MSKAPLVSILIPVWNRRTMIEECVQSALGQTLQDFEIVIADNASSDGTWEICQRLAGEDHRIRVFQNDSNVGPVRNWERCLREAKGRYAKFLFSDDCLSTTFLEALVPFLDDPKVGLVFCTARIGKQLDTNRVDYIWSVYSGKYSSQRFINAALFGGPVPVSPCCALCRLDDLRASVRGEIPGLPFGDFTRHGGGTDLLTFLLIAKRYDLVGFVSDPLVFFREHPGSFTTGNSGPSGLSNYYDQARVWFCAEYESRQRANSFLVKLWLGEMKRLRKWLPFELISSRYGQPSKRVRVSDIISCVTSRVSAKKPPSQEPASGLGRT